MTAVHHGTKYSKEATDRYADVNGIRIHYNEAGQGPALFCFHGGGPGTNAWDNSKHNLDELAEHFRCILMDMPGYGYSDKNAELGDTPLDLFCARIILGVMDQGSTTLTCTARRSSVRPACASASSSRSNRQDHHPGQWRGARSQLLHTVAAGGYQGARGLRGEPHAREHGEDDAPVHPQRMSCAPRR